MMTMMIICITMTIANILIIINISYFHHHGTIVMMMLVTIITLMIRLTEIVRKPVASVAQHRLSVSLGFPIPILVPAKVSPK